MTKDNAMKTTSTPPEGQPQGETARGTEADAVGRNQHRQGSETMTKETTMQAKSTPPKRKTENEDFRILARIGHRPVPIDPESKKPDFEDWEEFQLREPSDAEIERMSQMEPSATGIMLAWDMACLTQGVVSDSVRAAISSALGDKLEAAPSSLYGYRMYFRAPTLRCSVMYFEARPDVSSKPQKVMIQGPGYVIEIPSAVGESTRDQSEWVDPDRTLFTMAPEDLPELTEEDLESLRWEFDRIGFDCCKRTKSDWGTSPRMGIAELALMRADEWFPALGLPGTRKISPYHWTADDDRGLSDGEPVREGCDSHVRVFQYGIRIAGWRICDAVGLVERVRNCSRENAVMWLKDRLGMGRLYAHWEPTYVRLLYHTRNLGLAMQYDYRNRCPEISGGRFGADWQRMSDYHFSWLQVMVSGELEIKSADLNKALEAIWLINNVDPQRRLFESLPEWDGKPRINTILEDLLVADCPLDYAVAVLRSFMLSIMWMAYRPGHVHSFMPILTGGDRHARTALLQAMCREPGMFTNAIPFEQRGRKPLDSMVGKVIAEIDLDSFNWARTAILDAVLGSDTAHPMMPNPGGPDDLPRLCGLAGTSEHFKSLDGAITGNPNMWPISIATSKPWLEVQNWVRENRDQLWAEVKHHFDGGMSSMDMPAEMFATREKVVEQLLATRDPMLRKVDRLVRRKKSGIRYSTAELLQKIKVENSRSNQTRLGIYLQRRHGFPKPVQVTHEGRRQRLWTFPEKKRSDD